MFSYRIRDENVKETYSECGRRVKDSQEKTIYNPTPEK